MKVIGSFRPDDYSVRPTNSYGGELGKETSPWYPHENQIRGPGRCIGKNTAPYFFDEQGCARYEAVVIWRSHTASSGLVGSLAGINHGCFSGSRLPSKMMNGSGTTAIMKRFLFALLKATRVIRLIGWLNRRKVTILCYHGVTSSPAQLREDPYKLHLPLDRFLDQLDYLQRRYRIISLSDYLKARSENRDLPDYSLVLTFEDGFRNFATSAAPNLIERRLPATVFVITDKTNESPQRDDDTFLSWQDIQELSAHAVEFGSHTCSHSRLPDLQHNTVQRELSDSRTAILNHITQDALPLSYPHGQTSEAIQRIAESVGYSCGVTTVLGANDRGADIFALRRTVIAADDDLSSFAARVSGLTWWAEGLRGFFRKSNPVAANDGWDPDELPCLITDD